MPAIGVVLTVLAAVTVFAVAAVAIGREAHRLDAVAPRAIYDMDEAVEYVAENLPTHAQARMTHDEVRRLLRIHMGRLHKLGLQPANVTDRRQDIAVPTFLEEVDEIAYVIGGAAANDVDVTDEDVADVVATHLAYLDAIGAVGPSVGAERSTEAPS